MTLEIVSVRAMRGRRGVEMTLALEGWMETVGPTLAERDPPAPIEAEMQLLGVRFAEAPHVGDLVRLPMGAEVAEAIAWEAAHRREA